MLGKSMAKALTCAARLSVAARAPVSVEGNVGFTRLSLRTLSVYPFCVDQTLNTHSAARHRAGLGQSGHHDRAVADDARGLFAVVSAWPRTELGFRAAELVTDTLVERAGELQRVLAGMSTGRIPAARFKEILQGELRTLSGAVRRLAKLGDESAPVASLTLLLVRGEHVVVGHVGSTRGYLLRKDQVIRLTPTQADENRRPSQAATGKPRRHITKEAVAPKMRSAAVSLLGQAEPLEVEAIAFRIPRHDRMVLLSTAMSQATTGHEIHEISSMYTEPEDYADAIVEQFGAKCGQGDVACVVSTTIERRTGARAISETTLHDLQAVGTEGPMEITKAGPHRETFFFKPALVEKLRASVDDTGTHPRPTGVHPAQDQPAVAPHGRAHSAPVLQSGAPRWQKIPLFTGLNEGRLEILESLMVPLTVHPGEPLFVEGEGAERLYILTAGRLKECVGGRIVRKLEPAAVVGETALIVNHRRTTAVEPTTLSKVMSIRATQLRERLEGDPVMATMLFHNLAASLAERFGG